MARTLWVLRHAKTVTEPPPGMTDHERRLAPRGRRDADALAGRLANGGDRLGLARVRLPELVLCSTSTRTQQTAERVLAGMKRPPEVDLRRSLYSGSPDRVLREIWTIDDDVASLMFIGHNPTIAALAECLATSNPENRKQFDDVGFPTTALAVYRFAAKRWRDVVPGTGTLLGLFHPPY